MEDNRNHIHSQAHPFRISINTFSPARGDDRGRFTVELMAYVDAVGWEKLNFMEDNDAIRLLYHTVVTYEQMGYQHLGLTGSQLKTKIEALWDKQL